MNKVLAYVVLPLFIVFNFYLIHTLKSEREKVKPLIKKVKTSNVYTQAVEKQLLTSLKYNETRLSENVFIHDSAYINYPLHDKVHDKKLVFVLPDKTCDVCNDDIIDKIISVSQQIGSEDLMVVVSENRYKEFMVYFQKYNQSINCFGIDSKAFNFDEVNKGLIPYCFIVDSDLYVANFFLLANKNATILDMYFKRVLEVFNA